MVCSKPRKILYLEEYIYQRIHLLSSSVHKIHNFSVIIHTFYYIDFLGSTGWKSFYSSWIWEEEQGYVCGSRSELLEWAVNQVNAQNFLAIQLNYAYVDQNGANSFIN